MRCVVKGSRWVTEFNDNQPIYIVLINGELSEIHFTSAHKEGGWEIEE